MTNASDSGTGSLRQAIADANANPGLDRALYDGGVAGTTPVSAGMNITGPLEIIGPGAANVTLSGNDLTPVFFVSDVADPGVAISALELSDGANFGACGCGGAVLNFSTRLEISDAAFTGNVATWGGAIESYQGSLDIENSYFAQNQSTHDYGGGAIHVGEGEVTIRSSTFENNTATLNAGALALHGEKNTIESSTIANNDAGKDGGGVLMSGKGTIVNSTITGNTASKWAGGVGLFGKAKMNAATIAGNEAKFGGGIGEDLDKRPRLINSIVADNTATKEGRDLLGDYSAKWSLIESKKGAKVKGKKNIFKKDPLLGSLGDYGGPTETLDLNSGSPAIGKASTRSAPDLDQRGFARDSAPDMGAYEFAL